VAGGGRTGAATWCVFRGAAAPAALYGVEESAGWGSRRSTKAAKPVFVELIAPDPATRNSRRASGPSRESCRRGNSRAMGSLSASERRKVVRAFRSTIIPRRRAGRKQSEAVTVAYEAWKGSMRGAALFQTHVLRWDRLSRWRRTAEHRSLMEAIYSRNRRERAKRPGSAG